LVSWTSIKWYEGYPDVDVIEKFTCEMDQDIAKGECLGLSVLARTMKTSSNAVTALTSLSTAQ
jgi:hypothetical protein